MSEYPKRIYAYDRHRGTEQLWTGNPYWAPKATPYVRADIADAQQHELLEAARAWCAARPVWDDTESGNRLASAVKALIAKAEGKA